MAVTVTLRLLPNQIFNSSLGDYTQWVHSACPHWFGQNTKTQHESSGVEDFLNSKNRHTPVGDQI